MERRWTAMPEGLALTGCGSPLGILQAKGTAAQGEERLTSTAVVIVLTVTSSASLFLSFPLGPCWLPRSQAASIASDCRRRNVADGFATLTCRLRSIPLVL